MIRRATVDDAVPWIDLLLASIGGNYVSREVYDPVWAASQFSEESNCETWVLEANGVLIGSMTFLPPNWPLQNPICNLGRLLLRPEAHSTGAARALMGRVCSIATERGQTVVSRVSASDNAQQILLEQLGFVCCGYQPFKHLLELRSGYLFYVLPNARVLGLRQRLSGSVPQVTELAAAVLGLMGLPAPETLHDGATGYPLRSPELRTEEIAFEDYQFCRSQLRQQNPFPEVSGGFHLGLGLLRVESGVPIRALLGRTGERSLAGLAYCFDEHDRCVRIVDTFCVDEVSLGAVCQVLVKLAQDQLQATYLEMDVLASAPRLLKTAEQLGFVPVAYLPAFFSRSGAVDDVVKMVKLNLPYSFEGGELTRQARSIAEVVDRNFDEQKVGVAIMSLLRGLPIFAGLGDGEIRKMAHLFEQRLYRPGEIVFARGVAGDEVLVVMRGSVEIRLEEKTQAVAIMTEGKIFGELAFLDGSPRIAWTVAAQPSILLVVHRDAFNQLIAREPHLGMLVVRNIALELSQKLRQASSALSRR